mgnify:CR=1 FL=1
MIEWDEKYSVGLSMIDEEHKKFIDIINKAIAAKQRNNNQEEILEILNEMAKHAQELFKTEETYMIKFNYPEYQYHKEEHIDFSVKTQVYQSSIINDDYQTANEILEYLKQWLVNHIQITDKKYVECFKKNGLS